MVLTEIVSGTLSGMGCHAGCTLLLTSGQQRPRVKRCSVMNAPDGLPNGYYEARFSDQSAFLRRVNGIWGTGIAWASIPTRSQPQSKRAPSVAEWTRKRAV
jgi:hypothetical protein